jgi:5-methylcytosine-specific restriction endonuclease McrA
MMRLFQDVEPLTASRIGRNSYPHRPRVVFADNDGYHNLSLNEWGCYQLLSKPDYQTHDLRRALRLDQTDRQFRLLVGNMNNHRISWLVIHIISWCEQQQSLFATPRHVSVTTRMDVFQKYGHRCCSCQSDSHLTLDHIVPRSHGGTNDVENLQVLCRTCNSRKNDWPQHLLAVG